MKYPFAMILAVGLALTLAHDGQTQNFVETDSWSLKFRQLKFDKVQPGGRGTTIYHWLLYEVSNPGKKPRKVKLHIHSMINRVREGVSKEDVRSFNSFIRFKLPQEPADATDEFDNTKKLFNLKRYYDRNYVGAMGAVQAKIAAFGHKGGPFKQTSDLGTLGPGQSVRGVAVFSGIDKQMDFTGIMVRGLKNRIQIIADKPYIQDEVLMIKYISPGDATNAFENPIQYMGRQWVVVMRKKVRFPNEP